MLGFSTRRKHPPTETLVDVRLRLFDERKMRFAALRNANVLIYWPHGFGDFVHLGYLLPLLEPTNRYFIARYGDDFSELYLGNQLAPCCRVECKQPTICSENPHDTSTSACATAPLPGRATTLSVTPSLARALQAHDIDSVLWTDYPDAHGALCFPYHTKIRSLAQKLVAPERLAQFDLTQRLRHAVPFDEADVEAQAFIDQRLQAAFGTRPQLCLIQSGGHTASHKNWEEAEVLAFARRYLMEQTDRAVVLLNNVTVPPGDTTHRISTWNRLFADMSVSTEPSERPLSYAPPHARVINAHLTHGRCAGRPDARGSSDGKYHDG